MNGTILKNAVISGANNITSNKARVDDLNIFPVPDGDTGTNMSMTINAAVAELEKLDCDSVSAVAKKTASAMLRGARGNSGVITSLLFRGFSKGLPDYAETAGAKEVVSAFGNGVEAAYSAVTTPTEGTILTVAREAFEAGKAYVDSNTECTVLDAWQVMYDGAIKSLGRTPELLPVLKKAGVVDAGGMGLCMIMEGILSVLRDGTIIPVENDLTLAENIKDDIFFKKAAAQFDAEINFTYCTEFIVGRCQKCKKEPFELRAYLETIGDCVVVVDDEEIIKVHVHTEQPGNALQAGLDFGSLLTVKVENMKEQNKNVRAAEKSAVSQNAPLAPAEPEEEVGFVAVAAGDGIAELFRDLGCAQVVSGGQSMNPSTDQIYEAVMATGAKTIFVLPNNKNIIMAAQQVVPLVSDRKIIVLPTRTIPQGISAMLSYDPELNTDSNRQLMLDAASSVSTGQVTFAARNSEFGSTKIKEGEIISLDNGKLCITDREDPVKAAYRLIKNMADKDTSFITLIYGADITQEQAERCFDMVQNKFSGVDVTLVNGGQPVYYFIISIE
ncbi:MULTISPECIES: DAK2 domain-containing protein [unclassified Ruminococcus]|uniref:DAK2 domain-containing protein n=1 Tax=unclassified Ruminococcus TaxID=2608920 RepID=UPI00210C5BF3|nr:MULTISPECIES: DAK2 domain-containing protein [unclassified Ruminococcus]MCQ4023166.1 DAK2 domain-containing protein [Ruminococcus sp. zg-924]MCQ4115384.1 DAK2 domain-containing protein [Ruminococcus sp. zg-921]